MLQLIQVTSIEHNAHIRQLFLEYIKWLHENINREYELTFDVNEVLNDFMKGVDIFYPPQGSLYLANFGDEFVGIGCLKQLIEDIGEIKRMFVKDEYHGKGIGKAILDSSLLIHVQKVFQKSAWTARKYPGMPMVYTNLEALNTLINMQEVKEPKHKQTFLYTWSWFYKCGLTQRPKNQLCFLREIGWLPSCVGAGTAYMVQHFSESLINPPQVTQAVFQRPG